MITRTASAVKNLRWFIFDRFEDVDVGFFLSRIGGLDKRINDTSDEMNDPFSDTTIRQRHNYFRVADFQTSELRNLDPISCHGQNPIPVTEVVKPDLSRHDVLQQNSRQKFFVFQQNVVVLARVSRYQFSECGLGVNEYSEGTFRDQSVFDFGFF